MDKYFIYAAVTRCERWSDVYLLRENIKELSEPTDERKNTLIARKINGYMQQDRAAGRQWAEGTYITVAGVKKLFKDNYGICDRCDKLMSSSNEADASRQEDQWTVDRINDKLPHIEGNCRLRCLNCNSSRMENFADKKKLR